MTGKTMVLPEINLIDYFSDKMKNSQYAQSCAIITNFQNYTFLNIDEISTHLADIMRTMIGIRYRNLNKDSDSVIAVGFPRSERLIFILFAILKMGGTFLLIDTINLPTPRIVKIVETFRPLLIITDTVSEPKFQPVKEKSLGVVVTIEKIWETYSKRKSKTNMAELRAKDVELQQLLKPEFRPIAIYVSFTSQGIPIGIRIANKALWNRIQWEWHNFPYKPGEVMMVNFPSYNLAVLPQIFVPLLAGKPVTVVEECEINHFQNFLELVEKHQITRLTVHPAYLRAILATLDLIDSSMRDNCLKKVKTWFCLSGTLRVILARIFFKKVKHAVTLVHAYSAEEGLDVLTYQAYTNAEEFKKIEYYKLVPTAIPVPNTKVYVIDSKTQNNISEGKRGEICFSSVQIVEGLTSASSNLSSLSLDKFGGNPFASKEETKIYRSLLRTGDSGRIIRQGLFKRRLYFERTKKAEVIINIQRVDIRSIETQLKKTKGIRGCHVVCHRPHTADQELLAFVVLAMKNPTSVIEIASSLREQLPAYMIPLIIQVAGLPVKSDRQTIDESVLLKYFYEERNEKREFSNWGVLKLNSYQKVNAAKTLFHVIFLVSGMSKKAISEVIHLPLSQSRVNMLKLPVVVSLLRSNGYWFDMEELSNAKSLTEIIEKMVGKRQEIQASLRSSRIEIQTASVLEYASAQNKKDFFDLIIKGNFMSYEGVGFYYGARPHKLKRFFEGIWTWPILKNPISSGIRSKLTKQFMMGSMSMTHSDRVTLFDMFSKQKDGFPDPLQFVDSVLSNINNVLKTDEERNACFEAILFSCERKLTYEETFVYLEMLLSSWKSLCEAKGFDHISMITSELAIVTIAVESFGFRKITEANVNMYESADGTQPFYFAPDHLSYSLLYKGWKIVEPPPSATVSTSTGMATPKKSITFGKLPSRYSQHRVQVTKKIT